MRNLQSSYRRERLLESNLLDGHVEFEICNALPQKRLTLAAIFAAVTLCGLADRSPGAMIAFTGVIDDVQADVNPAPFVVGDIFSATLSFNYHPHPQFGGGGIVSEYLIIVNDLTLSGTIPTGSHIGADLVAFDTDPSHGSIFYQLIQFYVSRPTFFASSDVVLQAATPNGVIPPLDQFNLNQFLVAACVQKSAAGSAENAAGNWSSYEFAHHNWARSGGQRSERHTI